MGAITRALHDSQTIESWWLRELQDRMRLFRSYFSKRCANGKFFCSRTAKLLP